MPSHAFLGFQNPGTTNKRLDTLEFTIGGTLVMREKMVIAGTSDESYASVGTGIPALTDCGLSVRIVGTAAEDAGHTSGDPGLMILAVRQDTAGTLVNTNADYAPLQVDSDGNLRVNLDMSCELALILEGGTQRAIVRGGAKGVTAAGDITSEATSGDIQAMHVAIVSGGGTGGTASSYGAAFPATGTAVGFSDGTNMVAVHARIATPNGCDRGIVVRPVGFTTPNGDSMVDDTLNGLGIVLLNQLEFDQDDISVVGLEAHDAPATMAPVLLAGTASLVPRAAVATADVDSLWTDGCGRLRVIASSGIAHDTAFTDLVQPVAQGGYATSSLSGLTPVHAGDLTRFYAGCDGVQIVRNHTNLEDIVSGNLSNTDGSCGSLIAAQGSGVKVYLTKVTATNAHASTFGYLELTSGNKVKHTIPLPPEGGATVDFDPPLPPDAANLLWGSDPSAAITTVIVSAVGFKSKV